MSLPTHPTESVCAFLLTRAGRAVERISIVEAIWPRAETPRALNRLRTALVHIRQALRPALATDGSQVVLRPRDGALDLQAAEQLYRRSRIADSPKAEKLLLSQLLDIIGADFLEGWSDDWIESYRTMWQGRRVDASLRLVHLALDEGELATAEIEAERALSTDDLREDSWAAYLRVMAAIEKSEAAVERFRRARKRRKAQIGIDFSPDLIDFVKRLVAGAVLPDLPGIKSPTAVRDLMAKTFVQQLFDDPDSMLPVLAGEAFRSYGLLFPVEARQIVAEALERTQGTSLARVQTAAFAMRLAQMQGDYGNASDHAEWIIESTHESTQEHRFAVNLLGFMNFEVREWQVAWEYLTRNLELAETYGNEFDVSSARMQRTALRWHQGDLEGALVEYEAPDTDLPQGTNASGPDERVRTPRKHRNGLHDSA